MNELLCIVVLGILWKAGDYLLKRERQARQIMSDTATQTHNHTFINGETTP